VEAIDDPQLETLLDSGWKLDHSKFSELASMNDIDALAEVAQNADLSSVRPQLADLAANLAKRRNRSFATGELSRHKA